MAALKEMFNKSWLIQLAESISMYKPDFDKKGFVINTLAGFAERELNDRMRHTSNMLHQYLDGPFNHNLDVLQKTVVHMPPGYTNLVFPDYVSVFGLNESDNSLSALHYFTRFGSSEFAIRVFLKNDFKKTLSVMKKWAKDENEHVRRLASEGSRPRLPWSFHLPQIIQQPSYTLPILKMLVTDHAPYVRKSVANHLNDISKDHPELTLQFAKQHLGIKPETDKLLKHACRTLLKAGNSAALGIFGTAHNEDLELTFFELSKDQVKNGQKLSFSFGVKNNGIEKAQLRCEFALYFLLLNGSHYRKIFKISERSLSVGEEMQFNKYFSFRPITTRQYRPGKHKLGIVINGAEKACLNFTLLP